jgi:hypothetical protein
MIMKCLVGYEPELLINYSNCQNRMIFENHYIVVAKNNAVLLMTLATTMCLF